MEVKRMIASAPRYGAFVNSGGTLIRLALDTEIHNLIPADSAVVHLDIPAPKT